MIAVEKSETRRWGTGARIDDPQQGADRIIAAAARCFAEHGVASTTVEQIAQYAGVSRRTVYRYFASVDAIIQAVVERQAEPFFEQLQRSLSHRRSNNFRDILVHYVLFTIEKGPHIEGHRLMLGKANAAVTIEFYLQSRRLRDRVRDLLGEDFEQAKCAGEIDQKWRLDDLLNWMGRLICSFIQYPECSEDIERMVSHFLLPSQNSKS